MKKILLIEDDLIIRESTAELLDMENDYTIFTAENGKIGIQVALKQLPDIIICDVMMPEVNGFEVLKELSKDPKTQSIPFIFLSAKTERRDIRKGMNLGADDYITKPFSEDELKTAIESRIAKALILKESATIDKNLNTSKLNDLNDLKKYFHDNGKHFTHGVDQKIYEEGQNSNYVYLITKGTVKSYKNNKHGKILTTSIYKEGDLFGYTSFIKNQSYQETSVTITVTELAGIKKLKLAEILQDNHKVLLSLVDLFSSNLKDIKNQLLDMAYDSVHKKTAATLLKFTERINPKPNDLIKISRQDLANVAGISTETLIRSVSKLKKEGIIDVEGRNIKILDINALKSID